MPASPKPRFFADAAELRAWLEKHHATKSELWVGFYKKASKRTGISYPESVDEALCFGWIDGIRKTLDAERYVQRFTPRKPRSNWSAVNIARMAVLEREGRVRPAGRAAFASRVEERSGVYSYENRHKATLDPAEERQFRAKREAWKFFQAQPSGYRSMAIWWLVSAKRADTRARRLDKLIEHSAVAERLPSLARPSRSK